MNFTYDDCIAQGVVPPCKQARFIASSDPIEVGDCWIPYDSTEIFVAWEQRVMETGGRYTYHKWWVPQSEFQKRKP